MIGTVTIFTPVDPRPIHEAFARQEGARPHIAQSLDEVIERLPETNGLVIGMAAYRDIHPVLATDAAALRWVQFSASGYDLFEELGGPDHVTFMRAVGVWGQSVGGHAIALALALLRRLPEQVTAQRDRRWIRGPLEGSLRALAGRRVLVVGYGDIGSVIAAAAQALGAEVTAFARRGRQEGAMAIHPVTELDRHLPGAEVVVLAMPGNADTADLFDRERLSLMREGSILVNVGRGEVLDEEALVEMLETGRIGGAGLDVFRSEPLPPDSPLWSAPNTILTPHTAALGDAQSLRRLAALCVENAIRIDRGLPPIGRIG